jgi:DNA-directed RNA polymerase subunit M/transcription elongation factor TFIIS
MVKQNACTLDFISKSKKVHGDTYDYTKVSIDRKTDEAVIVCKIHGKFRQRAFSHQQGYGCKKCGAETASEKLTGKKSSRKLTGPQVLSRIAKLHPTYDLSKAEYIDLETPLQIRCRSHKSWFYQKPRNALYIRKEGKRGQGCPKCHSEATASNVKLTLQEFQERVSSRYGKALNVVSYKGMQDTAVVFCRTHGNFETNRAQDFYLYGRGCPKCNPHVVSYLENKLAENFPGTVRNDRSLGFELDLYWPRYRLGVELNGVYWHSTKFKADSYHRNKTEKAKQHRVRVLHFWGSEVQGKFDLVKSMIHAKLGSTANRVGARKLDVRPVNSTEANLFFDDNHLQGSCVHKVAFGLYSGKELLACASFAKPRFNKTFEWELIRFAVRKDWSIPGAASRLLSAFEKTFAPKSLLSYANLRFSTGKLYRKLGFEFSHQTAPNYWWYLPKHGILSRYKTQKHKLRSILGKHFDPNLSETAMLEKQRAFKLFDCGNLVYVKVYD